MKARYIDLNCDMGELISAQSTNYDEEIMPYISSCNISCGFHSGHPVIIENTIRKAIEHKVAIGAHPSYNDRENFGRQSTDVPLNTLLPQLRYQICAVKGMVESLGGRMKHIKAHGALYNDMTQQKTLATAFVQLIKSIDPQLKIYALAHTPLHDIATKYNMQTVHEVFADRKYQSLTQLKNRKQKDAVFHTKDAVLHQVEQFINCQLNIEDVNYQLKAETICLHSDTQNAVKLSQYIYEYLKNNDVQICAPR